MYKEKNIKYKSQERKNSIIIITILVCIVLIALTGILYQLTLNSFKVGYVSLQPINLTLSSEQQNHKISVKITLSGKSKNLNKLNMEGVQLLVKETITKLDYDSIVDKDGNEYIKSVVLTALRQEFGNNIEQVNLDSILTDVTINNSDEEAKDNNSYNFEDYLKGFSWTKKK